MKYRPFGKTGWKASALGFGCMRLPTRGAPRDIDEGLAVRMIRRAIDAGVNYVDTAYPYHAGMSEVVVGKALKDGYREKVKLATKLPVWLLKKPEDIDRIFNEQLGRLQTDRVDMYLLHSLGKETWQKVLSLGILQWAERQKASGRIGWIGFSFHDEFPAFKEIVDGWDKWDFCQIQYNYMNTEYQAGAKGLKYAADRGLAVVIMEPLLGGGLSNPPPAVTGMWKTAATKRTASEWALQWLWDKPEVSLLLSGMTSMAQVEENLASADRAAVGVFTAADQKLVERVADAYRGLRPIPCTECNYCMPCPHGVNIPRNLAIWNERVAFDSLSKVRGQWGFMPPAIRATACTACKECEEKCPQSIVIHEWMSTIGKAMEA
ncbi:MAG: aldo/keto reductase [Spirochaetia bacterium]|jgi:hypothetical protein